ncbi:MAG: electron transport complex subunit RsxC [Gammaproteobacteria bacterium]|nr:electron transport complex subunit RsxC [Gammaproteobacteria bacterium]MBU1656072.1 electron transport complex subunit RsxC [Gammaproteobacteria bacterium]MBU1960341.1 electron transport complex subunit RsxC [Gammaproteobacteria bacterium]
MTHPYGFSPSGRMLWEFHGGVHMPDMKSLSNGLPTAKAAIPPLLVLPLRQHIGEAAEPLVKAGDRVLKGEKIARGAGILSASLHAPTSGILRAIAPHPIPHAAALTGLCILLEPDGEDRWGELPPPMPDFAGLDPGKVIERIRWAGIVGMGGAAFPSAVKLAPGPERAIHTLIINGAECEPYISCDDRLMREQAQRIVRGIRILRHVLDVTGECLIGVEDNKPEAIEAMRRALAAEPVEATELVVIPTIYPSGGEKQLIRILTGREVPSKGIPAHIGIVCHNVATAAAVADAVLGGRPLISRYVTVTGGGVVEPGNLDVLLGTPAADLIAQRGGFRPGTDRLILGGPMMGLALHSDRIPITKGGNCLLAPAPGELIDPGPAHACIRCGRCADACPMQLLPQQLYWHARARDMDRVQEYNLFDCIECGCCAHVCPSHIPLVQYYRFAKGAIWGREVEKRKAERARVRHEARQARLERLEQERKARLRKKTEALKSAPQAAGGTDEDPKKAAIKAALERAKAKKAAQAEVGAVPKNTAHLTEAQQRQIDEADQRRGKVASSPENKAAE